MRSARPKVLHTLAGRPMIAHVLAATAGAGAARAVVVLGHGAEEVRAALPPGVLTVVQEPQLGTGHAVRVALDALDAPHADTPGADAGRVDTALILYADMPLLRGETLRALLDAHGRAPYPLSLLSAVVPHPTGYGRILRDAEGRAIGVKEQKELAPDEEGIGEINVGVYCADLAWLRRAVRALPAHPDGEYYLPDLVPLALDGVAGAVGVLRLDGIAGAAVEEARGVNTRVQLAEAGAALRARINRAHMLAGVTVVDPATTYIEPGVAIGRDTTILPNTHLRGDTHIGPDCTIGPDTEIADSVVDEGAAVARSVVEGARVGPRCHVGPFAHLRHGAILLEGAQIGNYAEVKNSTVGAGSVSHHVSYIGDTTIGANVNIGAGTVTVNYDGARKHRTVIGDGAFVGSGTMLRAPVTLGARSRTGAGAVVTRDVAPGVTVAGVPARPLGDARGASAPGNE